MREKQSQRENMTRVRRTVIDCAEQQHEQKERPHYLQRAPIKPEHGL